jgi:hypothetical protein
MMSPRLGDEEANDTTKNSKKYEDANHPATESATTLTSLGARVFVAS